MRCDATVGIQWIFCLYYILEGEQKFALVQYISYLILSQIIIDGILLVIVVQYQAIIYGRTLWIEFCLLARNFYFQILKTVLFIFTHLKY